MNTELHLNLTKKYLFFNCDYFFFIRSGPQPYKSNITLLRLLSY